MSAAQPDILDVRIEAVDIPIGHLAQKDSGCRFTYAPDYLALADAMPISLSLPLREETYGDVEARAFFDNLLQENDQLQQTMDRERIARDDIVGLLRFLGADCAGAISCLPPESGPVKIPGNLATDYDELPREELADIMRRLAEKLPLPDAVKDPSPVAGVQRKIALTEISEERYGLPKPGLRVPTTHILKVPERGRQREALQEAAATRLARAAAFDTAIPALFEIGGETGLLSLRFDRRIAGGGVTRIHQEDFCQALGLPASMKYERRGTDAARFSAGAVSGLLDRSNAPAKERRTFMLSAFFNLAIGNNDNHAKNHALLYDTGPAPRLAPLYDLQPVRLTGRYTDELAFKIGNADRFDSMTTDDIADFMSRFGLRTAAARRRFIEGEVGPMLEALDEAASELSQHGLKDFDDLIGRETAKLRDLLDLDFVLRERDYFAPRGGGWGSLS